MKLLLWPLANAIGPYIGYGLGDDPVAVPYSMLATLLAAIIERPFFRLAGAKMDPLKMSIQANVLSAIAGVPVMMLAVAAMREIGFLFMMTTAIPFSIAIEGYVLNGSARRRNFVIRWKPLILGNILSGVLLLAVTIIGFCLNNYLEYTQIVAALRQIAGPIDIVVGIVCAVIFLWAFTPSKTGDQNVD